MAIIYKKKQREEVSDIPVRSVSSAKKTATKAIVDNFMTYFKAKHV